MVKWVIFILLIIIVLVSAIPDKKVDTESYSVKNIHKTVTLKKQPIIDIVKKEAKVFDAIFPNGSDNILDVAVSDDGTRRDGFAEYLCVSIKSKIKLPHQILIRIIDYNDIIQKKDYRVIGKYLCR